MEVLNLDKETKMYLYDNPGLVGSCVETTRELLTKLVRSLLDLFCNPICWIPEFKKIKP